MEVNKTFPEMDFDIETIMVVAKSRKLNATWAIEPYVNSISYDMPELTILRFVDGSLDKAVYSVWYLVDEYQEKIEEFKRWAFDRGLAFKVRPGDLLQPYEVVITDLDEDDVTEMLLRWQ
jgi:hypothetical protein